MLTDIDLRLLARIVGRHDDTQQPVTAATLADVFDTEKPDIEERLASLAANELLTPAEDGYRPTVTARELLELDIDLEGNLVVLDFDPPDDSLSRETERSNDDRPDNGSPGEP